MAGIPKILAEFLLQDVPSDCPPEGRFGEYVTSDGQIIRYFSIGLQRGLDYREGYRGATAGGE